MRSCPTAHAVGGWCNLGCVPHTLQPTRRACPLHVAREAGESGGVGGRCRVFREFHTLASLIRIYVLPCARLTGTSPVTLARFPHTHTTVDTKQQTHARTTPKKTRRLLFSTGNVPLLLHVSHSSRARLARRADEDVTVERSGAGAHVWPFFGTLHLEQR